MGLVINTNVSAINTAAALNKSGDSLKMSMERLSTGKEINSAADNAAGKAIATNMTKQLNELEQGINNAKDGENLLSTMDGAASAIEDMTQRMRTLTVQALNGTYQDSDRALLDVEFAALSDEITRVADSTSFNGINLIGDDAAAVPAANINIQVGSDTIALTATDLAADALGINSTGAGAIDIQDSTNAAAALIKIDLALTSIIDARTNFGAESNRLSYTTTALESTATNTAAARSQIEDADFAKETTNLARAKVLQNAGIAMLQQANAQTANVEQLLR